MVSKGKKDTGNYYISALPFIAGAVVTIIVGTISYLSGVSNKVLYLRMAISMLAFYSLGLYVKSVLLKTIKEIEEKGKKRKKKE